MLVPVTTPRRLPADGLTGRRQASGDAMRPSPTPTTKHGDGDPPDASCRRRAVSRSDRAADEERRPSRRCRGTRCAGRGGRKDGREWPAEGERGQGEARPAGRPHRAHPGRSVGTYELRPIRIDTDARARSGCRRRAHGRGRPTAAGSARPPSARPARSRRAAARPTAKTAKLARRVPPPRDAAFEQAEDQQRAARRAGRRRRSRCGAARARPLVEAALQHTRRRCAEREVDEEDPAPGEVLGEHPAERRDRSPTRGPDAGDVALDPRALLDGVHVADHRHGSSAGRRRRRCPGGPGTRSARHAPREAAQHRAEQEDRDAEATSPACGRRGRRTCRRAAR